MLDMRFNLRELTRARGFETPYSLAKASDFAISITTAARLLSEKRPPKRIDFKTLDVLCEVLDVDASAILEREKRKRR